jgi:DnaJ-class molecular chaperone
MTNLKTCPKCDGEGWVEKKKPSLRACPLCNGSGSRGTKMYSGGECRRCRGTGRDIEIRKERCPKCGGKGQVHSKQRFEIVSQFLAKFLR